MRAIFFMHQLSSAALLLALFSSPGAGMAQSPDASVALPGTSAEAPERSISDWLQRMHEASRRRTYVGTFVVSSGGQMASSRIWHACDGQKQIERVEALTGVPRSTFRRNDEVVTFSPQTRVAVSEKRESLALFPQVLKSRETAVDEFYGLRREGGERIAGHDAEILRLMPRDKLRFGYRVWSERKTGLVLKLQTLDADDRVLEEMAFSELQLDAPVSMSKLAQMMEKTAGYRVESPGLTKTTAAAEGWRLKQEIPGFKSVNCYRRAAVATGTPEKEAMVQWVFTDGLASVSLFLEKYDSRLHVREGQSASGATRVLSRRLSEAGQEWWLTAVGEVPAQTLNAFAQGMERKR